jgi:osomolarity two-component system, sensor histidine kinase NIK1
MSTTSLNHISSPSLFLDYIDLLSSHYEAGPLHSPVPAYNGPADERIERIMRCLARLARRAYTAEDLLVKCREVEQVGPDSKKRRSVSDTSKALDSMDQAIASYNGMSNNKSGPSLFFSDPYQPSSSPGSRHPLSTAEENDVVMEDTDAEITPSSSFVSHTNLINGIKPTNVDETPKRANSPMSISLDGVSSSIDTNRMFAGAYTHAHANGYSSAPPSSYAEHMPCPTCGKPTSETIAFSKLTTYTVSPSGSPLVVPPGPLAAAAFESGLSAVEELKLLKAQVQDVARVCNAVARGDLSQKITVPVQGVVMVQLKDVINTMVIPFCLLNTAFALAYHHIRWKILASSQKKSLELVRKSEQKESWAAKPWFWTLKVHGAS